MQKHESTGSSVSELRKTLVNLGLVLKVELGRVEDIEATLESLLSGKILFKKWSASKLYIWDKPPWDGGDE